MVKMIKMVKSRHDCLAELFKAYGHAHELSGTYGIGTIVECPCGRRWILRDSQMEGFHWQQTGSERHE